MHIEHVALWTKDLDTMKDFYENYFNVTSSELYHNQKTSFQSYFLSFASGSRLEITTKRFLPTSLMETLGYSHLAIAVGTSTDVDQMTEKLVKDGYPLLSGPRTTGDGYYEAVIQDPDGNLIELTTNLEK